MTKTYPFSLTRHGHDLEFRKNRCFNLTRDMEVGSIPMNEKEYDYMETLRKDINEILSYHSGNGIVFLPGRLYEVAKESAVWAAETRAMTQERSVYDCDLDDEFYEKGVELGGYA